MNAAWYIAILVLLFALQFVLTLLAKRAIMKCLPVIVVLVLMAACFVAYAITSWTNWAWLIILMLVSGGLVPIALAAVLAGIARAVKKVSSCK